MKKNIWIFNHYATNMFSDKGGRHYNFSKYLIKKGYNPTVFCANTYHDKRESIEISNDKYKAVKDENSNYVYVKTSEYKGNGFSRIKNMFLFAKNLMIITDKYIKTGHEKPDVIIASSVHPLTCIAGIFIAKRYRIPCIVEIRDLWPESIVEYSSKLTKKNLLIKLLYQGEKWIYRKADKIIFTMQGGADYIREQSWDKDIDISKIYHINNGVDLDTFNYNKENYKIQDEDLENDEIFKVIYSGSIRRVNNLGMLLDAAKEITNPKIKLLIWGGGDELETLKQRVIDEHVTNVKFKGHVDKKYIPYILSKSKLNILHSEFTNLCRYGSSQNKTFDYLASGKPILSTIKVEYDVFEKYNAGISLAEQSSKNIANSIEKIFDMNQEEYTLMSKNAVNLAIQYDFKVLVDKFINIIENI